MVHSQFSKARSRREVKRALVVLRKQSVNKDTKGKYKRQMSCMKLFLRDRGSKTMTVRRFEDFLVGLDEEGRAGSTAATYRSAWLFWREVRGKKTPSARRMKGVNRAIAGMRYRAGAAPGLPRGAMDSGQLKQLRFHAAVNGFVDEADGFALAWHGMLRHTALTGLKVHDVRMLARKGPLLRLARKKAFSAARCTTENLDHFVQVRNCKSLLKDLCKGKRGTEPLFKGWSKDRARGLIKEAAVIFDWDPTVKWDGMHCMRHGAAQEFKACSKDPVSSVMRRAVWSTISSAARYRKQRGRV